MWPLILTAPWLTDPSLFTPRWQSGLPGSYYFRRSPAKKAKLRRRGWTR